VGKANLTQGRIRWGGDLTKPFLRLHEEIGKRKEKGAKAKRGKGGIARRQLRLEVYVAGQNKKGAERNALFIYERHFGTRNRSGTKWDDDGLCSGSEGKGG